MHEENEPDRKIERQRAPPLELINFALEPRDQTQPGSLSLSRFVGTGRREPWGRGCPKSWPKKTDESGNPLKSRFECEIQAKIFSKSADPFAYLPSSL